MSPYPMPPELVQLTLIGLIMVLCGLVLTLPSYPEWRGASRFMVWGLFSLGLGTGIILTMLIAWPVVKQVAHG